jgi:hypothetical protein
MTEEDKDEGHYVMTVTILAAVVLLWVAAEIIWPGWHL